MLLAIDIGNTNVTLGVFDGKRLASTWRVATDTKRMPDEYGLTLHGLLANKGIDPKKTNEACICSVVPPLTRTFEEVCRDYFQVAPLVVGTGVKTGMKVLYDNPRDVGADRIADAVAAFKLYGGPVIVVDFGTATVFDAVSTEGDYIGGAIAPGLAIAAEALFRNTSQLRRVELKAPNQVIGRNTTASMQSGLIFGYVGLVESMVERFKTELGDEAKTVATGGLASVIAKETEIFDDVNPDLTLLGLKFIYEMNRGVS